MEQYFIHPKLGYIDTMDNWKESFSSESAQEPIISKLMPYDLAANLAGGLPAWKDCSGSYQYGSSYRERFGITCEPGVALAGVLAKAMDDGVLPE